MSDLQHTARLALACLDLTSLNDNDSADSIAALAAKAGDAALGGATPAALCVWPRFVAQARALAPAGVAVAAVANFPDGATDVARAVADAQAIVAAGGDEVDLVLPWRALAAGDEAAATAVVQAVRAACPDQRLKLILESGELEQLPDGLALVTRASRLGLDAGVDFLKTSTGKTPTGATPGAARAMLAAIAAHPRGAAVGFKASGGIRTVADAGVYIELVRELLGEAALTPQRLRFGASGLLGDIARVLSGQGEGNTAAPGTY